MIQVDVFWSFAMGACFASLAYKQLNREADMLVNQWFVYNLLFLSLIFAPSGAYLLWQYPGWESMFMLSRETIHGGLACVFAASNVLLGVIGFCVAFSLIKQGKELLATSLWVWSYVVMIGILGFGYRRFLYAGTEEEWAAGVPYDLLDWLGSPVFYTLLVMGVFVVPPLYWAFLFWPMEGGCTSKQVSRMRKHAFQSAALGVCVGVVGYWVFVSLFASEAQLQYLSMADFDFDWDSTRVEFSYYTPLLGFLTAEALFLVPVLAPLLLTRAAAVPE